LAEHNIDDVIDTGKYSLVLQDASLAFRQEEEIAYSVLEGGRVQDDGSIPCQVLIQLPPRLRGRVLDAKLVPAKQHLGLLMGLGVVGIA
jgi:hypothetical protein